MALACTLPTFGIPKDVITRSNVVFLELLIESIRLLYDFSPNLSLLTITSLYFSR